LYFVKLLPANVPKLFSGDAFLAVSHTDLYQFLAKGGFKAIRKRKRRESLLKVVAFWTLFIFSGVAAYYSFVTYEFPKTPKQIEPQKKEQAIPLPKTGQPDSLKNQLQSPKSDSTGKGHSSKTIKPPG
jgi:hypothetical protein